MVRVAVLESVLELVLEAVLVAVLVAWRGVKLEAAGTEKGQECRSWLGYMSDIDCCRRSHTLLAVPRGGLRAL